MAEEKELLTILSKDEYVRILVRLKKEFGKPEIVKRLALQCTDYRWSDVDTRIRITNGKAEIIQKVGSWKNYLRDEITVELPPNPKVVFEMYRIFRNMMKDKAVLTPIMQYENKIFAADNFEIKLTYQFGKKGAYNCEIEVADSTLDPEEIAKKFNIPIHPPKQTKNFWREWNKRVNLDADDLSNEKLLKIIKKYL